MKRKQLFFILLMSTGIFASDSVFYAGGHLNYARLNPEGSPKLKGYLAGLDLGYQYQHCHFFTEINYEGYWNAGPLCSNQNQRTNATEYFAKLKVGPLFYAGCSDSITIKPYVGFGYNYFQNNMEPAASGMKLDYTKLFIPIGFYACNCINEIVSVGLQGEWRPDIFSRVRVSSTNLEIKRKHAARIQVPFNFAVDCKNCLTMQLVPFFDWNNFGETTATTSTGITLPIEQLNRWYLGIRLNLGLSF